MIASRRVNSPHAGDVRIGVTSIEHEVLDRVDAIIAQPGAVLHSDALLDYACKAAAAALRARRETGMIRRRRERAIEAAAQLLAALRVMDDGK
jgi:hypothetical protein